MSNDININFYDNYVPALKDGQFTIGLAQTLAGDASLPAQPQAPITQQFIVRGPRFTLSPGLVSQVFPPANSSGSYDQYLPQIVLNRPSLPWERDLISSDPTTPWLALLVFNQDELPQPQSLPAGSQQNPACSQSVLLNNVINPPSGTLGPSLSLASDEDPGQIYCNVIDIPVATFNALLPSLADLPFLAHTRQVSLENKAATPGQTPQTGWFSAVIANRFAVPPTAPAAQTGNIVHLVSLEGFESVLNQNSAPTVTGYPLVRMISLYSWTYTSQADPAENFSTLMNNLVTNASTNFLLALPLPNPPAPSQDPVTTQTVQARLQTGYIPLRYAMLSGDQTFAWYRGPLSPVPVSRFLADTGPGQAENPAVPFTVSDAMIFDPASGLFDQSYATAFQTGRSLALASASFAQSLLNWRAYAHNIVDLILEYMTSSAYASKMQQDGLMDTSGNLTAAGITDLAQLLDSNIVTQAFQDFLATSFYDSVALQIGQKGGFTPADSSQVIQQAPPASPSTEPIDLITLMQQPLVTALLQSLSGLDDLGTLSAPLTGGGTSLSLNAPGTSEVLQAGISLLLYSPDGSQRAWVTIAANAPAGATSVDIQPYAGSATLPTGSALYVQDPNQDAAQVVEWLAGTALLYNVPFNNLVAHPSLLPQESIRFFYLDQNWTDALLDGALSIGLQTGRDSLFQQLMRNKLYEAVQDVMTEVRDTLLGITSSGGTPPAVQPAGFILRSQGVTNWPGLEIQAWSGSNAATPMKPLRLDQLASDTLLAIYPDVPTQIAFTEPSEGLVFGMEDQGVELRYIPGVTGFTTANIGTVIPNSQWLNPQSCWRNGTNSALNITSLVTLLQTNLPGNPTLTPASFAVEMVRVPEQMLFTPQA
jgi:hypothetical protein